MPEGPFNQERIWTGFFQESNVVPEKAVAGVVEKTFGRVNGEALTWRAADNHVKISAFKVQFSAERGGVYLFDGTIVSVSCWVVRPESLNGPATDVVCVEADKTGTAEAFCYASGATKEVYAGELADRRHIWTDQIGWGLFSQYSIIASVLERASE